MGISNFMTKNFFLQQRNGILFVILLVVSGIILFTPFVFRIQKHSFLYFILFLLKIIALPVFVVSSITLITLGFVKASQTLELSAGIFLTLVIFLLLAILYAPLWSGFRPNIPDFDPHRRYTVHYANPFNTEINYINIDYLNRKEVELEIQQTSLKRQQYKLDYDEFVRIITALNELKSKSRYSLVICPIKFLSRYTKNSLPYLRLNGVSFYFHPEKRFLKRYGLAFPRWCYNFPKLESNLHRVILDLVNKR